MRKAARQAQRRFKGLGQPRADVGTHLQAVDHHLDAVFALRIQVRPRIQFVDVAVDAHPHEALARQILEHLAVFALAVADQRRQQRNGGVLGELEHLVDHLADGLGRQIDAVVRAARQFRRVRTADAGSRRPR